MTLEPPQKNDQKDCKPFQANELKQKNTPNQAAASRRKNRGKSPGAAPTRPDTMKHRMANAYFYRVLPFDSETNFRIKPTHTGTAAPPPALLISTKWQQFKLKMKTK